jgi:hypothetical protein
MALCLFTMYSSWQAVNSYLGGTIGGTLLTFLKFDSLESFG